VNREFGRITGRSEETLLEETVLGLFDPADQHLIVGAYEDLTTGLATTLEFEARVRRAHDRRSGYVPRFRSCATTGGDPTLSLRRSRTSAPGKRPKTA